MSITDEEVKAYLAARSEYSATGCRLWLGCLTKGRGYGYGMTGVARIKRRFGTGYVHKIAYLMANGPLPEGTEMDHICNVRNCINVEHLRPLTHVENIRRATKSIVAQNMVKTHCKRGHPFQGDNVAVKLNKSTGRTGRSCRRCHANTEAARRSQLRAAGFKLNWRTRRWEKAA